jgi:hypothetical protein
VTGGEGSLWFRFVVAALATWRLTHLLAFEDGPFALVARVRAAAGRAGRLFDCFYCLSVWIAAPLALFVTKTPVVWLCVWPALSGVACIVHRATSAPVVMQPVPEGDQDALLRTEARDDRG